MDGAAQMAVDRAVLEHADQSGSPTMRVYGWHPWCISLGYHQDEACLDRERLKKGGVDAVRRPTGGRAVFHADEVTYSVVLPPARDREDQPISGGTVRPARERDNQSLSGGTVR